MVFLTNMRCCRPGLTRILTDAAEGSRFLCGTSPHKVPQYALKRGRPAPPQRFVSQPPTTQVLSARFNRPDCLVTAAGSGPDWAAMRYNRATSERFLTRFYSIIKFASDAVSNYQKDPLMAFWRGAGGLGVKAKPDVILCQNVIK